MSTVYESYQILFTMQSNFHLGICEELFGGLAEHIYQKWIESNENMLNFLTRLDQKNINIMLLWGVNSVLQSNVLEE